MNLYAESSAILAWLLDEAMAPTVRELLGSAEIIVTSDLTLIECDRVLMRAITLGELAEAEAADRRAQLAASASHWHVLRSSPEAISAEPFPDRLERLMIRV